MCEQPAFYSQWVSQDQSVKKPGYANRLVTAEVRARATTSVWAGSGPTTHYEL